MYQKFQIVKFKTFEIIETFDTKTFDIETFETLLV